MDILDIHGIIHIQPLNAWGNTGQCGQMKNVTIGGMRMMA